MHCDQSSFDIVIKDNWINVKNHIMYYMIGSILSGVYMGLGSFMFLYIEHCYDNIPKEKTVYESTLLDLCKDIKEIQNLTENINKTETVNVEKMLAKCVVASIDEKELKICEVTLDTFAKWAKFTIAVCCTIGMSVNVFVYIR